jgi:hypothetical protein
MLWICEDILGELEDEKMLMDKDECILYSREREMRRCSRPCDQGRRPAAASEAFLSNSEVTS